MFAWRTKYDPKAQAVRHSMAGEQGRSLLVSTVASLFQDLRLAATLWDGEFWHVVHREPGLNDREVQHGVELERWRYNDRNIERATEKRQLVRGEHRGFSDLFAPVVVAGQVEAILVVGAFATELPSGPRFRAQWLRMTGRKAHPLDLEFTGYLQTAFSLLVAEGERLASLEKLVSCVAQLLGGGGDAAALATQANVFGSAVRQDRIPGECWAATASLVANRAALTHYSPATSFGLTRLGLSRAPTQVLVGLAKSPEGVDPVDDVVRRHLLQRRAAEIARETGDALAGQVGDHGVVVLSAAPRGARAAKQKTDQLSARVERMAREELGFQLAFGLSSMRGTATLSACYAEALGAAELALGQGLRRVEAKPGATFARDALRALRDALTRGAEEDPDGVPARFERYAETVSRHFGHNTESASAHLEVGFDTIASTFEKARIIEPKSLVLLRTELESATRDARTVRDLVTAFGRGVSDLAQAAKDPVGTRRTRGIRSALELMHRRYGETLTLAQVAKAASFAPKYFSSLFREQEGQTFERYLTHLRFERAKQLLTGSELSASRIAELCGFRTPQYLAEVFRRELDKTPTEYRQDTLPHWAQKGRHRAKT